MLAAFVLWITITLPFSMYFENSLPLWDRSIKIYLMLFVTLALIRLHQETQYIHLDTCAIHRFLWRQGWRVSPS